MPPELIMLVGGNGAGKSTFYRQFLAPLNIPFVNADLIARELWPDSPEQHSYEAAHLAERQRTRMLEEGVSFCFETVFSHGSKVDFMAQAKLRGYRVKAIVIHLAEPNLNILRVQQRVEEGGHAVPEEKVRQRIPRALSNIKLMVPLCDDLLIFDNGSSDHPFQLLARCKDGLWTTKGSSSPLWLRKLID